MKLAPLVAAVVAVRANPGRTGCRNQGLGRFALQTSSEVLGPQFERATGHKLNMNYAGSSELVKRFAAGEAFDVAMVWPAQIDRLLKEGKLGRAGPVPKSPALPSP